jgi:hypothetical protein
MFTHTVVEDTSTWEEAEQYQEMHHLVPKLEALLQERLDEPESKKEHKIQTSYDPKID